MSPRIRPDVTVQQVGDESLVLDLETGQIHQLNATAAWILARCTGANSVESISSDFAEYFSVDSETATGDVNTTIEQLSGLNVIVVD